MDIAGLRVDLDDGLADADFPDDLMVSFFQTGLQHGSRRHPIQDLNRLSFVMFRSVYCRSARNSWEWPFPE